jgi:hypothetical protein
MDNTKLQDLIKEAISVWNDFETVAKFDPVEALELITDLDNIHMDIFKILQERIKDK